LARFGYVENDETTFSRGQLSNVNFNEYEGLNIGKKIYKTSNTYKDDFDYLNTSMWSLYPNTTYSISNGTLVITNGGIKSNLQFPVGTSVKIRVKRENTDTTYPHLISFTNSTSMPESFHGTGVIGVGIYGSSTNSAFYGTFRTEDNYSTSYQMMTQDNNYHTWEIKRISSTLIEFYLDDVKKYTLSGRPFANDYSIVSGATSGSSIRIDWIEITAPNEFSFFDKDFDKEDYSVIFTRPSFKAFDSYYNPSILLDSNHPRFESIPSIPETFNQSLLIEEPTNNTLYSASNPVVEQNDVSTIYNDNQSLSVIKLVDDNYILNYDIDYDDTTIKDLNILDYAPSILSTYSSSPLNAIDNNTSTYTSRACTRDETLYEMFTIKLESALLLDQISILFHSTYQHYNCKIEVSTDNVTWTTWYDGTNEPGRTYAGRVDFAVGDAYCPTEPQYVKYIKVWSSGNSTNATAYIYEIYIGQRNAKPVTGLQHENIALASLGARLLNTTNVTPIDNDDTTDYRITAKQDRSLFEMFTIELPYAVWTDRISLLFHNTYNTYNCKIEVSLDKTHWSTWYDGNDEPNRLFKGWVDFSSGKTFMPKYPQRIKYVKVYCSGNNVNAYAYIYTVKVREINYISYNVKNRDVALSTKGHYKIISSYSTNPLNVLDDLSSYTYRACAQNEDLYEMFTIELPIITHVSQIGIHFHSSYIHYNCKIEVSTDNETWTTWYDGTNEPDRTYAGRVNFTVGDLYCPSEPLNVKYIKIWSSGNSSNVNAYISEIFVKEYIVTINAPTETINANNIIDDNISTYAYRSCQTNKTLFEICTLSLSETIPIDDISILFHPTYQHYNCKIEVSTDNETWTTWYDGTNINRTYAGDCSFTVGDPHCPSEPQNVKYIKVWSSGNSTNATAYIYEITINSPNILKGASIIASNSTNAQNAISNNLSTYAYLSAAINETLYEMFTVKLPYLTLLDQIGILFHSTYQHYNCKIEVSTDNRTWTTWYDGTNESSRSYIGRVYFTVGDTYCPSEPQYVKYIKIWSSGNTTNVTAYIYKIFAREVKYVPYFVCNNDIAKSLKAIGKIYAPAETINYNNVIDNIVTTYAYRVCEQNENLYEIFTLELSDIIKLTNISLLFHSTYQHYNCKIEVSTDNETWITWYDGTNEPDRSYVGRVDFAVGDAYCPELPIDARYIKVWSSGNSANATAYIYEIYIETSDETYFGASIVSSFSSNPQNAIDNNISTYTSIAAAKNETLYEMFTIKLAYTALIDNIGIQFHTIYQHYNCKIEVSTDNETWITWYDGTNEPDRSYVDRVDFTVGDAYCPSEPQYVKYIKIWSSGNTTNVTAYIYKIFAREVKPNDSIIYSVDLSSISSNVTGSKITWDIVSYGDTEFTVLSSLDNGNTWSECIKDDSIPGISSGTDLSGKHLLLKAFFSNIDNSEHYYRSPILKSIRSDIYLSALPDHINDINKMILSTYADNIHFEYTEPNDNSFESGEYEDITIIDNGIVLFDNNYVESIPAYDDLDTVTTVGSKSISAQVGGRGGSVFLSIDGTKMYASTYTGRTTLFQYNLTTPWNIQTAVYEKSLSGGGSNSIFFSDDGLIMISNDNLNSNNLKKYILSTPWDIGTAVLDQTKTLSFAPFSFWFNNDGTIIYILNRSAKTISNYTLSTPYDLDTLSSSPIYTLSISQASDPSTLSIYNNGENIIVGDYGGNKLMQYNLSEGWDLSTASYSNKTISYDSPMQAYISRSYEHPYMYVASYFDVVITQYQFPYSTTRLITLSTPDYSSTGYHISSFTIPKKYYMFKNSLIYWDATTPDGTNIVVETSIDNGTTWNECSIYQPIPLDYNVPNTDDITILIKKTLSTEDSKKTPTLYSLSLNIETEVNKEFTLNKVITNDSYTYNEYNKNLFNNGTNNNTDITETAITLSTLDGSKQLPIYNNINKAILLRSKVLSNISAGGAFFISNDGRNLYYSNWQGTTIYQYSLTIPWDITNITSIGSKATTSCAGIYITDDGTKMFTADTTGYIRRYTLSTPWLVSSATEDQTFAISGSPTSIFLNPNGSSCYIITRSNDTLSQYTMATPFDLTTMTLKNNRNTTPCTDPMSIVFCNYGTTYFISGYANNTIYQYNLSVPWDISTTIYSNITLSFTKPMQLSISKDRNYPFLYIMSYNNKTLYQYQLGIANGVVKQNDNGVGYKSSGTHITSLSIPETNLFYIKSSKINWAADVPTDTNIKVETSLDNGTTWQECTKNNPIPNLPESILTSDLSLLIRKTLTTNDPLISPALYNLSIEFKSDDIPITQCSAATPSEAFPLLYKRFIFIPDDLTSKWQAEVKEFKTSFIDKSRDYEYYIVQTIDSFIDRNEGTFEFIIYPYALGYNNNYIINCNGILNKSFEMFINKDKHLQITCGDGSNTYTLTGTYTFNSNTAYLIAFKWSSEGVKAFVNNQTDISNSDIHMILNVPNENYIYIGSKNKKDYMLNGYIIDYRISDIARSDTDIVQNYPLTKPLDADANTLFKFDLDYTINPKGQRTSPIIQIKNVSTVTETNISWDERLSSYQTSGTYSGRIAWSNSTSILPDTIPSYLVSPYNFAIVMKGKINIPTSDYYIFALDCINAADVFIDNIPIVSWYGEHNLLGIGAIPNFEQHQSIPKFLTAGQHDISVRYENISGNCGIALGWKKVSDTTFSIIPSENYINMTYDLFANNIVYHPYVKEEMDKLFIPDIIIESNVSLDNGYNWTGWQRCSNNQPIPNINVGEDVSNGLIMLRETLNPHLNDLYTPMLNNVVMTISGSGSSEFFRYASLFLSNNF
jgi:hypothetical protein